MKYRSSRWFQRSRTLINALGVSPVRVVILAV
jgi:hypothetical protein